jgi:hypothetical protein
MYMVVDLASWIKIFKLGTILSIVLNNVEYLCMCGAHGSWSLLFMVKVMVGLFG